MSHEPITAEMLAHPNHRTIVSVLEMIAADAEQDAQNLDRAPFDARTVGTNLGNLYAMVHRLALVCADQERRLADIDRQVGNLAGQVWGPR